jgi:hypothetical protein
MTAYVDPVAQPSEYQRMLLDLLGNRDPAEVQSGTPSAIRTLAGEAGDLLRERPEPKEWSVFECIAHICDAELVIAGRYRWILAQDRPEILPYDQDLWIDRFHAGRTEETIDSLMAVFEPLRAADILLWQKTPIGDRARYGLHRERGPESYELTFRLAAGHDIFHLDQARRALDQVRARGS